MCEWSLCSVSHRRSGVRGLSPRVLSVEIVVHAHWGIDLAQPFGDALSFPFVARHRRLVMSPCSSSSLDRVKPAALVGQVHVGDPAFGSK